MCKLNVIIICIISILLAGCSRGNNLELIGNTFRADDGGTIRFTSSDSCVVEQINWHNVFGDLANELEFKEEYKSTWKYIRSNTIQINTGEFVFNVDRPNIIDEVFSLNGSPYIFILIGDPDDFLLYQFYKQ